MSGIIFPTQDQLQGFAYFLIKQAGFEKLHNPPQNLPRFFNFSQIFGGKKKDDNFYFIFSFPLNPLIDKILRLKLLDKEVRVGQNLFVVEKMKMIKYRLRQPFRLVAETPIIVRVPANRFKDYGLELDKEYKMKSLFFLNFYLKNLSICHTLKTVINFRGLALCGSWRFFLR